MSVFSHAELAYLREIGPGPARLARLATVGDDGMPHVAPVGWRYNAELDTLDIGGIDLTRTMKYRDIRRTGRAALVIDDVLPPWKPRAIEVRGRAEALDGPQPLIRIHPQRVISWGLEDDALNARRARDVG